MHAAVTMAQQVVLVPTQSELHLLFAWSFFCLLSSRLLRISVGILAHLPQPCSTVNYNYIIFLIPFLDDAF